MDSAVSRPPRTIPPQPTIAWFLRDLIPDKLWNDFDIGNVRDGQIAAIQRALLRHGGRDAWLRFVEQTRTVLPQLLSVSIFDEMCGAVGEFDTWPRDLRLDCHPVLSVYVSGRLLHPTITLHCYAKFEFANAGQRRSGEYTMAVTEIALRHANQFLIESVRGRHFVRAPPVQPAQPVLPQ
ncbi:hypothetical protein BN2475_630040 [Paraburkholderia ribeironis]|uniref:Uncharacterized protein n=1 Tax=Paraburkholderia ribeironis TaxID=1247936 RepID=A0A1N7SGT1_9BURK|nr:hypothetical protein [Paraburkholderia ribeironis]SIT46189.1 hypothetical protein BN2475_630040 [Paraburkholderia ribeironis]